VNGIVLAGTYNWSGSAFESLCPRPLLPVAQQPLVAHALAWMHRGGLGRAIICANGSTNRLRRHLDATPQPLPLGYHEDSSPRGAAGCVKDAAAQTDAATLVVTDGTSIPTADLHALLAQHESTDADITIAVYPRQAVNGRLHYEPTGIYVFKRDVLEAVPATSFQDIKENLIPKLHRQGSRIDLFTVGEISPRVLNAASYLAANRWMISRALSGHDGQPGEQKAHPSAWVAESAMLIGPVLVGPGARVHASATVVGPASIGPGTVIEPGAVVTRSVTWENCVVGRDAVVDNCVMANGAVVKADSYASSTLCVAPAERRSRLSQLFAVRRPQLADAFAKPAVS
jgi:mannose-1-phosphate guanylyltransferase